VEQPFEGAGSVKLNKLTKGFNHGEKEYILV
jgi:hypothetical protein